MNELLQAALSPVNLLYTFLLALVLLYWLTVIVGALDMNALDVDFDLDMDSDIDIDVDSNVDVDSGSGGWFAGALQFFNFGKMPMMIILSFTILFTWMINILMNHYIGQGSMPFAIALMLPNLFVSLLLTKLFTTPLVPLFAQLNTSEENVDYIGMTCKVLVPATETKKGQAEVFHNNSALLVYIKVSKNDVGSIRKGEQAVIVDKAKDSAFYYIRKSEDITI